jgi:hypothetical protein
MSKKKDTEHEQELYDKLEKLVELSADNYLSQLKLGMALNAVKHDLAMEYKEVFEQVKGLRL